MDKRLISFRSLQEPCFYRERFWGRYYCNRIAKCGLEKLSTYCNARNCPVWRRLKKEGK